MIEEAASTRFAAGYHPLPGHFDEMCCSAGAVRPHWQFLVQHLDVLGPQELQRRWEQAQRQLRELGVTYNPADDTGESSRPWELDAVPLVLPQLQWQFVERALQQRARLFERILEDLLGPRMLLRDRVIPPELLYTHPAFQPAYHGLTKPPGRHLILYSSDLARAPDGSWWATGDRTLAPSGLGYVLENRVITSRMLPIPFREANVLRLAPFFMTLRETLQRLAPRFRDNPRIVLWSQGPASKRYFEDAYLSRYLNYTLAEGGDLAVRENRVMLKTLGGLLPVEVILRRVDDENCDPVELNQASATGVPGLMEALRAGNVASANALGSRLIESPVWLSFLPSACRYFFAEDLVLPSIATWWCGQRDARQYVLEHLDELLIRPAFRVGAQPAVFPRDLSCKAKEELIAALQAAPYKYVGQAIIPRSTAPVWSAGELQPWHVALRAFVVAGQEGFEVLPGGLARGSATPGDLENVIRAGQRSQDVWVTSDAPVEHVSLLASPSKNIALKRSGAELPSRVADHLFWLGRNVERADATARLLRTTLMRLASDEEHDAEVIGVLLRLLVEQGMLEPGFIVEGMQHGLPDVRLALPGIAFNELESGSLGSVLTHLIRHASVVRDRISLDAWRIVRQLDQRGRQASEKAHAYDLTDVLEIVQDVIVELAAFAGLGSESMTQTLGWRFLQLGRRLERAWQVTALVRGTMCRARVEDPAVFEAVLEIADSVMTYRSRYLANLQVAPVIDLLLCDETNPRSVVFQLSSMEDHIAHMPRHQQQAPRTHEERLVLSMLNAVRLAEVNDLAPVDASGQRRGLDRLLVRILDQLPKLSDAISGRFLIHAGLSQHFTLPFDHRA